jgi:hypothetical protein
MYILKVLSRLQDLDNHTIWEFEKAYLPIWQKEINVLPLHTMGMDRVLISIL